MHRTRADSGDLVTLARCRRPSRRPNPCGPACGRSACRSPTTRSATRSSTSSSPTVGRCSSTPGGTTTSRGTRSSPGSAPPAPTSPTATACSSPTSTPTTTVCPGGCATRRTRGWRCTSATPSPSSTCPRRWPSEDDRDRRRRRRCPTSPTSCTSVLIDAGATEDELAAAPAPTVRRRRTPVPPARRTGPHRRRRRARRRARAGTSTRCGRPGTRPGHLCFHVPAERLLLSGDHVLPSITPHISISRRDRGGDPLGDFLDSLREGRRASTPPRCCRRTATASAISPVGPRRSPATTSTTCVDIETILADGPASLWQIAARLTWNRPWDQLPAVPAPLGGERDRRAPALPDASRPGRPAARASARSRSPCPEGVRRLTATNPRLPGGRRPVGVQATTGTPASASASSSSVKLASSHLPGEVLLVAGQVEVAVAAQRGQDHLLLAGLLAAVGLTDRRGDRVRRLGRGDDALGAGERERRREALQLRDRLGLGTGRARRRATPAAPCRGSAGRRRGSTAARSRGRGCASSPAG